MKLTIKAMSGLSICAFMLLLLSSVPMDIKADTVPAQTSVSQPSEKSVSAVNQSSALQSKTESTPADNKAVGQSGNGVKADSNVDNSKTTEKLSKSAVVASTTAQPTASSKPAETKQPVVTADGWQGNSYYRNNQALTGWQNISGVWYNFDQNGQRLKGQNTVGNNTYVFDDQGKMEHSQWFWDSKNYHWLNADGSSQTGWGKINSAWYHFDAKTNMSTGWLNDNGSWYQLGTNKEGWIHTGWYKDNTTWYHMNNNGVMNTGWYNDGWNWYYLENWGGMHTGWYSDTRSWYHLDTNSGAMNTGWYMVGGHWYHSNASGAMNTGWYKDGQTWYHLANWGGMDTNWYKDGSTWYHLASWGGMNTGWFNDGWNWYHLANWGGMDTGWYNDGWNWYYLSNWGGMVHNGWSWINGRWRYFNNAGAWNPQGYFQPSETTPYPNLGQHPNAWLSVSLRDQSVSVIDGNKVLYKMICSTGENDATPHGTYYIQQERGQSFYNGASGEGANNWVSFKDHGIYLFHSVPVNAFGQYIQWEADNLGYPASHGCVRLTVADSKWIHDNVPTGMRVVIG